MFIFLPFSAGNESGKPSEASPADTADPKCDKKNVVDGDGNEGSRKQPPSQAPPPPPPSEKKQPAVTKSTEEKKVNAQKVRLVFVSNNIIVINSLVCLRLLIKSILIVRIQCQPQPKTVDEIRRAVEEAKKKLPKPKTTPAIATASTATTTAVTAASKSKSGGQAAPAAAAVAKSSSSSSKVHRTR